MKTCLPDDGVTAFIGVDTAAGTNVVDVTNDEITIDTDAILANQNLGIQDGEQVDFKIEDVVNPEDAGRYAFEVEHFDADGDSLDRYRSTYKIGDANLENNRFYQGQILHVSEGNGPSYELYEVTRDSGGNRIITSNNFITVLNFDDEGTANIGTSSLEGEYAVATTGQQPYNISTEPGSAANLQGAAVLPDSTESVAAETTFTVSVQSLSSSFDDSEVEAGEQSDLVFDSNRNSFRVSVEASGLSTSDLEDVFASEPGLSVDDDDNEVRFDVSGDQIATGDFTGIDTGDYTFNFDVVDTEAEASASISVTEQADGDAVIANGGIARAPEGDIASIPIELDDTDTAEVNIGYNDVGFNLTATITDGDDDGVVTLEPNLYQLGRNDGSGNALNTSVIGVEDDSDSIELSSPGISDPINSPPLNAAAYDINVTIEGDEAAVGTLQITSRTTDRVRSWTAPGSVYGDLEDNEPEVVYNAIDDGAVTQSNDITREDLLVWQVQSTSVFGALESEEESDSVDTDDYSQALVNLVNDDFETVAPNDFEFEVNQTNSAPNQAPTDVALQATENNDGPVVIPD